MFELGLGGLDGADNLADREFGFEKRPHLRSPTAMERRFSDLFQIQLRFDTEAALTDAADELFVSGLSAATRFTDTTPHHEIPAELKRSELFGTTAIVNRLGIGETPPVARPDCHPLIAQNLSDPERLLRSGVAYQSLSDSFLQRAAKRVTGQKQIDPASVLLDIGSGSGVFINYFAKFWGTRLGLGIDYNHANVHYAQSQARWGDVRFRWGDSRVFDRNAYKQTFGDVPYPDKIHVAHGSQWPDGTVYGTREAPRSGRSHMFSSLHDLLPPGGQLLAEELADFAIVQEPWRTGSAIIDEVCELRERESFVGHSLRTAMEAMFPDEVESRLVVFQPQWAQVRHLYERQAAMLEEILRTESAPRTVALRELVDWCAEDFDRRDQQLADPAPSYYLLAQIDVLKARH